MSTLPDDDLPFASGQQLSDTASDEERAWKDDLRHAICFNNWNEAKAILDEYPSALTAVIADDDRTALHVAAIFGHVTILEELVKLVPPEFLLTRDSNGDTALGLASQLTGITQIAKCLVEKNSQIHSIADTEDNLPLTLAFGSGYKEIGRYLYYITPLEYLKGRRGSRLLRSCFVAQCFDIALDLLQRCEELLLAPSDADKRTPIHEIATLKTTILSPSELIFWKRWIYNYINVPSTMDINHVCVDTQQEDKGQGDKAKTEPGHCLLQRLITSTNNFVGVKKIQELKLLHAQADDLLLLVRRNARKAYQNEVIYAAFCLAAKEGNVEFVFQISKVIPEIFISPVFLLCFFEALKYRQASVFNLIHGFRFKHIVVTFLTPDGNTFLHQAAKKAPDIILNRIYGPALQIQRELQWFKEVEMLMPPSFRVLRYKDGMTAQELFREHHGELMKQGEDWIKATASSYSLVGILIVTIIFAVAFTLPGGYDQNSGFPLFIKQPNFNVFVFSTIISLVSSSTSVLMFLAILTSPFSEEAFLEFLPSKLLFGVSTLLISIVAMIITFMSSIHLMLKHTNYPWGILPIILFTSVPISYSLFSLIPVIRSTAFSAYGSVFDRKVKPWP